MESVTLTASYTLHCSLQHQSFLFVIIFLHLCHSQILVAWLEAVAFGVFVVLYENTIHDVWNLGFDWLKQNDQVLHGTITGASTRRIVWRMDCSIWESACSISSM